MQSSWEVLLAARNSLIRVSSGNARGRILKFPKGERPTLGRIKQTLFDIIAPRLEGVRFLDVFAGSGAVGIEALSRGASRAVFIEAQRRNVGLIRENLERCGFSDCAEVLCAQAKRGILRIDAKRESFDITFLDPPYARTAVLHQALQAIADSENLLVSKGIIIVQRSSRVSLEGLPQRVEQYDSRKIGESALDFLRWRDA